MNTENELQEVTGTRWQPATLIYAVLTGGLILSYLVTQAFDKPNYEYPAPIALLRLIAAAMGIYLGKLWKDKGFWLMIAYLAYKAVRIAVKDPNLFFTSQVSDNILNGLWVVAGCYALGRMLTIAQLKHFLRILVALWTAGALIHCGLALFAAWTDQRIVNLSGGGFWGNFWGRVVVSFYYPTTSGSAINISIMMAAFALLAIPGKPEKVCYFMSLLVMIVTLSLTDARTSFISAAVGIGVAIGCTVMHLLYRNWKKKTLGNRRKRAVVSGMLSFVCMTIVSISLWLVLNAITPAFIRARDHGGVLIPLAKAEEKIQKQRIVNRGVTGRESLTGRDIVWENAIGYLHENPGSLMFGDSIHNPMLGPNARYGGEIGHCHNMVLQIVLESGIIGFLFVVLFAVYVLSHAVRLIFGEYVPLWKRVIPAIPISVLVGDLAECFGWFRQWNSQALVILFLTVGIIVSLGKNEKHPGKYGEITTPANTAK